MNIKNLFQKQNPKQLNTTTRRATGEPAADYDTAEPNVRLSRAFLVVMLLHVVAVGGIFAFSSIKKNNLETVNIPLAETPLPTDKLAPGSQIYVVSATDTLGSVASAFGLTRNDLEATNRLSESTPIRAGDKLIIPEKSTAKAVPLNVQKLLQLSQTPKQEFAKNAKETTAPGIPKTVKVAEPVVPAAGKIYIVQKGDNPVLIAKKQGIKYADLLEANKITDPKKLQIGQKLIIPQK